MNRILTAAVLLSAAALVGCESMGTAAQDKTVQGATLGGLLGAGTGAIIGNQTGHAGAGTAIGAALGAVGGGMMGNAMKSKEQTLPPASTTTPAASGAASSGALTKFCPVGGELYAEDVKYCPNHGVELRYKEQ